MNENILVTGGLGFIGSHFIDVFLENQQNNSIVNLDKITYAANEKWLSHWQSSSRYQFVKGDICNAELVDNLFEKYRFSGLIHFAAESHVDNSIVDPEAFVRTNIHGTFVLLNAARKFWIEHSSPLPHRFHHISTDEVFGSLGETGYFRECTAYAPNSPYSATKAGSDFLVRSYNHTYGLNTVITNCSNNFGPRQHQEKLIPTIIRKSLSGEEIPIYGDGLNVRDWLYVKDHCSGLELAYLKGEKGATYNIGGDCEWSNLNLAELICLRLDELTPRTDGRSYCDQITHVKDRKGHDRRYAIDSSKIQDELGWKAETDFSEAISSTIKWYLNYERDIA